MITFLTKKTFGDHPVACYNLVVRPPFLFL